MHRKEEFERKARDWTRKYAMSSKDDNEAASESDCSMEIPSSHSKRGNDNDDVTDETISTKKMKV